MTAELVEKGLENASHTKTVEVGRGVLASSGTIIRDGLLEGGRKALLVADERTWKAAGADIPKYSRAQYQQGGAKVPMDQAQPGDLVFWGYDRDPNAIHHVAMYTGDNEILQAPQPGENVERSKMWDGGELLPMAVRPSPGGAVQASG